MLSFYIVPSLDTRNTKFRYVEAPERSWYHESVTGKQDLLITVGDSWTWGDSLGRIDLDKNIADDMDHRTLHIFGNLLAKKLDRDFLMLAKCGATNSQIHSMAFGYIDQIKSKYRKITVIITLTELAREITGDPWWLDPAPTEDSLDGFLSDYESNMLSTFHSSMLEHPDVQWILARNFTMTYASNTGKCSSILEKTWVNILEEAQMDKSSYPKDARIVSQLGFVPLEEYLQSHNLHRKWRRELYDIMASASLAIDWLMDSDLNYKKATKHPTERGHELWADYLYDIVKG